MLRCATLWREYGLVFVPLLSAALFAASLGFLLAVAYMDSGVIHPAAGGVRVRAGQLGRGELHMAAAAAGAADRARGAVAPPWEQTLNVDGQVHTLKYCYTCRHSRPPHAFHCATRATAAWSGSAATTT